MQNALIKFIAKKKSRRIHLARFVGSYSPPGDHANYKSISSYKQAVRDARVQINVVVVLMI